jgi:co-chaperonin GroES (HSP10)
MSEAEHLKVRGQEAKINGIAPYQSIDVEMYKGKHLPNNWEIVGTTGDVLLCKYADQFEGDGELVDRGGILVNAAVTNEIWRVAEIKFAGPQASEEAQPGALVLFPSTVGLPMTKFDGENYIFLNESRILAYVKPRSKDKDTMV